VAEGALRREARRAEEHDGVADVLAAEPGQRLEVLREDAERARVVAVEELRVAVREGGSAAVAGLHGAPRDRTKSM
jgi:hypothetical protein